MPDPKHVELARLEQAAHYTRGYPTVQPRSLEEGDALARIDEMRAEERAALLDTPSSRRRSERRKWARAPIEDHFTAE